MKPLLLILLLITTNLAVGQHTISDPVPFPKNYIKHPVFQKARSYSKAYDWQRADEYWHEFSLRYPDARPRYFEYGSVKIALGEYEQAKKLFEQAYLANPFDGKTIMEYMMVCALTKDNITGRKLADQLGRVVSATDYNYYDNYITQQTGRYTGAWQFASDYLSNFRKVFNDAYQQVGSTATLSDNIRAAIELKAESWEQIMEKTFELKSLLAKRGVNPGAYHWFLADQYEHVQAAYGTKGDWVYSKLNKEMIKEYKSESEINIYYKARFGKKLFNQYVEFADFDRALILNSKLMAELIESGLFRYNLIDIYTERTFTLYQMERFGELNEVANSLTQLLKEYKNPNFTARAYETLCAAYSKDPSKQEKAIKYGEAALKLIRKNKLFGESKIKSLLSICYLNNGNIEKGLQYAGLGGEQEENNYISMYNIGAIYGENGEHEKALSYYKKALQQYEETSSDFTPEQKLTSRARLALLFSELVRSNFVLGRHEAVYETLENYKASTLSSLIDTKIAKNLSLKDLQSLLKPGEVYLSYKMTSARGFLVTSVDNAGIENYRYDLGTLIRPIKKYFSSTLQKLDKDLSQLEYKSPKYIPVDPKAEESTIPINKGDFALITELYRKYLTNELSKYMNMPPKGIQQVGNTMSKEFFNHFLGAVPKVKTAKTLYISPDGPLHFIPFETLQSEQNKYLIESHEVKMVPSATVWSQLKKRSYSNQRNSLLAFGGAIYEEAKSEAALVKSISEINEWQLRSYELVDNGAPLTDLFKAMGYGKMAYLPGTLAEVQNISKVFVESKLVTGKEMSEKYVKDMSLSGELRNYRYIHFATHGWVINSMPKVAGLAMSIPTVSENGEDGMLISKEVSQLALNADMVMLSACQTGLGKLYGGEGVSGLSQAFLAAGANSTIVSLWPVNDYATSILVSELYHEVNQQQSSFATALAKVKNNFISGKYNTDTIDLRNPIYWAPFVYNGL